MHVTQVFSVVRPGQKLSKAQKVSCPPVSPAPPDPPQRIPCTGKGLTWGARRQRGFSPELPRATRSRPNKGERFLIFLSTCGSRRSTCSSTGDNTVRNTVAGRVLADLRLPQVDFSEQKLAGKRWGKRRFLIFPHKVLPHNPSRAPRTPLTEFFVGDFDFLKISSIFYRFPPILV